MKHLILKNGSYAIGQYVPEGATIIDTPRPTSAHSWDGSNWIFDGFSDEETMSAFRFQRNRKLAETDWEITKALETGSDATALKKYRQALRDLPSSAKPKLDENGQLTGVEWPNKPE
tara:strand:+ start:414 stop:764 length:351 start_codon:yes stop_codon:yes gene_type:complete